MTGAAFRLRFRACKTLIGTFVKTPSPQVVEVLGGAGLDFIVIDAEHAPFDRRAIDLALLAARAAGLPALVRTADHAAPNLLAALDDGAAGVVAPHIHSVAAARDLVTACRYAGDRGYSNSPRAGAYGRSPMWQHVDEADAATTVIAMIESREAVEQAEEIMAIDGLDGIFVGRADLTVSLGDRSPGSMIAHDLAMQAIDAAGRAGKPSCIFVAGAGEAQPFADRGATAFVVSSDQSLLRAGVARACRDFESLRAPE